MRLFAWVLSCVVPRPTRSTATQLLYLIDGAKIGEYIRGAMGA